MPLLGVMLFALSCVQSTVSIEILSTVFSDVQDALDRLGYPMFSGLCYYAHNDVPCVPQHPVIADTNAHPHNNHHHCHYC